jgi:tetratricopeptide (TPR) repeat protein
VHYVLSELGRMASERNDHDRARQLHDEALRIAQMDGSDGCIAIALAGHAHAAAARGDIDEARTYYRQALDRQQDSLIESSRPDWIEALTELQDRPA